MKIAFTVILLILAVLACGCTTAAPSAATATATPASATTPAIPNLIGTWTGTMLGYDEGTGFSDYNNAPMSMVITEQKGRIFAGTVQWTLNNIESSNPVAGVIGRDGKTFAMTEKDSGYTTGQIIGTDEVELTFLHSSTPYSVAIDTLKRV